MNTFTLILFALIILSTLSVILMYNLLVVRRNRVQYALSSIDAMLKKRYDLIPNLIKTVRQYMKYEQSLLTELTELRAQAVSGHLHEMEKRDIESKIERLLRNIIAVAENYPELKASSNFLQLQAALNEVEEQLSAARRAFSAAVTEYNNAVNSFPSNIIASLFNFREMKWFEVEEQERQIVNVDDYFNERSAK